VAEDSATFDNFWKSLNPQNQEKKKCSPDHYFQQEAAEATSGSVMFWNVSLQQAKLRPWRYRINWPLSMKRKD
jgi:hypothetical protein